MGLDYIEGIAKVLKQKLSSWCLLLMTTSVALWLGLLAELLQVLLQSLFMYLMREDLSGILLLSNLNYTLKTPY